MEKITFLNIFKAFFKIGAILLGGGYVIIPIMNEELVKKRHWLNNDEICDYYCISQCLPGIIAINISILVGYKLLKIKGVVASIFGMVFSPFVAIIIIAKLLNYIIQFPFVEGIFWGVNLSVIVLIYLALKEMWNKSIVDLFSFLWFALILILFVLKVNPACLIIFSIVFGLVFYIIKGGKNAQ